MDDGLHDPFLEPTTPRRAAEVSRGPDRTPQVLLEHLSTQITEMNNHVLALNQRVVTLEAARPSAIPQHEAQGIDNGIRARMQALNIQPGDGESADDDWEVAGACSPSRNFFAR
jgi:hypothetical protein